jgi:uncharacterized protein
MRVLTFLALGSFSLAIDSPLHLAAYEDDTARVTALLAGGAKADEPNAYGITPLLLACENGNTSIVHALLTAGADANAKRKGGETALMVASRTGKVGPVEALLAKGADVNAKDKKGQTALMWAAAEGHAAVIPPLLQAGADLKHRLDSGFTALLFAAREGKTEAVKALLQHGADANEAIVTAEKTNGRDAPNGTSAVFLAMENGYFSLAMDFINAGADPNDQRTGFTALHAMTWVRKPPRGDDEAGAPPPETHGPLNSLDFLSTLVKAGAQVDAELGPKARSTANQSINYHGASPFFLACRNADVPMMQRLLELGANPQKANQDGSTPLMAAAGVGCFAPTEEAGTEEECLAACELLLKLGADVNHVDQLDQTAMHGPAYKSLPKLAKFLDSHGAQIDIWNRKNKRGWTPLLIAQGYRPGNFKPSVPTTEAFCEIMRAHGIEPPPAPPREGEPKKIGYESP